MIKFKIISSKLMKGKYIFDEIRNNVNSKKSLEHGRKKTL
jgi:hypothetical protein